MKESMRSKLKQIARRLEEIDAMLASPDVTNDINRFRDLSRERAEIEPVVLKLKEYESTEGDMEAAREMLEDPESADFAQEEIDNGKKHLEALEKDLQIMLLPRDPNDSKNIYLEIRAGTGGDESALFAGDLLRMYTRYAERQGWSTEIVSASESDLGGYKEGAVSAAQAPVGEPDPKGGFSRGKGPGGGKALSHRGGPKGRLRGYLLGAGLSRGLPESRGRGGTDLCL